MNGTCLGGCSLSFAAQKNLHRAFARLSPVFALLAAMAAPAPAKTTAEADAKTAVKRQSASAQYARAEEQRETLNSKAPEKRTLADYKQVVMSYRRVALITPRATEVPDSLLAVAELYMEMGDRFGRSYYQSAAETYQLLVHEYPTSKYCQDAILRTGRLQRDQLGDAGLAKRTYEDFLKRYPRSPKKREAQEALAELALLQNNEAPSAANNVAPSAGTEEIAREETRSNAPVHSGGKAVTAKESPEIPRVRQIRAAANGDGTRVTIDLENGVEFTSGRIANPDRIFFDLQAARLAPEMARATIHPEGELLTAVRVAQNNRGVVRVVLDVNGVKEYSAWLVNNPPQLLIDLYGYSAATTLRAAKSSAEAESGAERPAANSKSPNSRAMSTSATGGAGAGSSSTAVARNTPANAKNGKPRSVKAAGTSTKPDLVQPASTPQPTRDGQATLTRTLGLKIGRIVIDAGHGGHDTGTIGPTGLMEKDLCLDVALRLGKIIEQRLPGADVVYTRSDDTFIPLEERTRIANEAKADMFISIHANSSQDTGARGIETYYLNLRGSPEAMEVAARENATDDQGIHELQDLVKQIARTEKIDESKEFAQDVQDSLSKRIQKTARTVRNRGVRKAPFVVLIGADMPSILTEISFLSNPADEKMLKQPEHRQRVAEGIYQGVASYLQSLNSMGVNQTNIPAPRRTDTSASVESSRNRN